MSCPGWSTVAFEVARRAIRGPDEMRLGVLSSRRRRKRRLGTSRVISIWRPGFTPGMNLGSHYTCALFFLSEDEDTMVLRSRMSAGHARRPFLFGFSLGLVSSGLCDVCPETSRRRLMRSISLFSSPIARPVGHAMPGYLSTLDPDPDPLRAAFT